MSGVSVKVDFELSIVKSTNVKRTNMLVVSSDQYAISDCDTDRQTDHWRIQTFLLGGPRRSSAEGARIEAPKACFGRF